MRAFFLIAGLSVLSACASLTEEQCRSGDWVSIGFNDGVNGRTEDYISRHFDACEKVGITPDTAAWLSGRAQGLPHYCTVPNVYNVGRNGRDLSPVCPTSQLSALRQAHDWGEEYYLLDQQIREVENEIDEIDIQIASLLSHEPLSPEEQQLLYSLRNQSRRLEQEVLRLERRQLRYDSPPF